MRQVFFCAADYYDLPKHLATFRYNAQNLCRAAWEMMPDIELVVLRGKGKEWQRARRMQAEGIATDDIYILADDDSLPLAGDWGNADSGEFAICSAYPIPSVIHRWTPQHYQPLENEHISVGGIRIVRRGAMKDWPPMDANSNGYDAIQCEHLRFHGKRVGFHSTLKHMHLGEGRERSTVWQ